MLTTEIRASFKVTPGVRSLQTHLDRNLRT